MYGTIVWNQFCKSPPLKLLQTWRRVLSPDVIKLSGRCLGGACFLQIPDSELYIYGRLTSVNCVIKKCNTKWRNEGLFGRHFQSPYVRGQIFLQIFVWFFVAESLSEWVFSILKQQDRNETALIS